MAKQACVDCHFFVKKHLADNGSSHVLDVSVEERQRCRNNDFDWQREYYVLECSQSVWGEGFRFSAENRFSTIVETERTGFCFFWKYRRGLFLSAATELQKREWEQAQAARDRRLTIWGLWIAAAALAVDVYLRVAERLSLWPYWP